MILAITAAVLAYETKGLLIGESARSSVVEGIRRITHKYRGVKKVNEVLTMHMGPEFILVNLSVEFNDDISTEKMEDVIARIDKEIKQKYKNVKRIFIEAEAWRYKH